jgi:hypothetical protein
MSGVYGNYNLLYVRDNQYIDYAAASEQSVGLDWNTEAVSLYSDQDCWVAIGTNPTAAAPGAEKTKAGSFFLPATLQKDVAVPKGTDAAPILVAVIQDSAAGVLHIQERSSV